MTMTIQEFMQQEAERDAEITKRLRDEETQDLLVAADTLWKMLGALERGRRAEHELRLLRAHLRRLQINPPIEYLLDQFDEKSTS